MLISLEINDNRSQAFLDFLKDLDFVKVTRSELSDEGHLNLLNERLGEYHKNPDATIDADVVMQKLKAKYGF